MKTLKRILFVILGLVAILLIVALFVHKDYAVVREVNINKPKQEVFDYIKFIKNQDYYSVWVKRDPAMQREFKGTDGTVGFISAWDSQVKGVGTGEQEIMKITEGERMDVELRFKKPFEATDYGYLTTESLDSNQTKVKWGFYGTMKYPFNLMLAFMSMDDMVGKDLETGLTDLKSILEKK